MSNELQEGEYKYYSFYNSKLDANISIYLTTYTDCELVLNIN